MPGIAGFDLPGLIGALEFAAAQAAKDLHFAHAQHHEVGVAVAVNVQRVGANGIGQLQARALFLQFERSAAGAAVAVKLGLVDAGRNVDLGQAVAVAVKRGHAATNHEFILTLKPALQSCCIRFFNKTGDGRCSPILHS